MSAKRSRRRHPALLVGAAMMLASSLLGATVATPASAGTSHQLIDGSGSTWAQNAVDQWISDVQQDGLKIVFTGTGSAQGRKDFANLTTDFAVSDIGFQGHDPLTGASDTSNGRPYAYEPIVAGGTSFPYQINVAGRKVTNLRLSGLTLAKIFTNVITNWDDPEITADNNGRRLPSIPIIPVVDSQGAGTTAQFTTWLATEYPSLWTKYSGADVETEYWPRQGAQISQPGSNGIMNFITSAAANGAIGAAEFSYAVNAQLGSYSWPVARIENTAGYFTAPTQYNVAVALTQAEINTDKSSPNYLLQNLTKVYTYHDPRTYPLSSYSYVIIPTSPTDPTMTTAKRQTLADYLSYSVCQGQAEIGPVGYSSLPINLVEASFQQTALLKKADPGVSLPQDPIAACHNPTFIAGQPNSNYLAKIAPFPPLCDKAGQGPCVPGYQDLINGNPVDGHATAGPTASGAGPSGTSSGGSGAGSSAAGANTTASAASNRTTPAAKAATASVATSSATTLPSAVFVPTPTLLGDLHLGVGQLLLAVLAVVVILVLLVGPPLVLRRGKRRKEPA
jgi:phosphate transport system substrate-binding protein